MPFLLGTLAFYCVILGAYLLNASSLYHATPNWRTVVPIFAGLSFYLTSNLFLMMLGRGYVSRWIVLRCILLTFALTSLLCLALRSRVLYEATDPSREMLRHVLEVIARTKDTILTVHGPSKAIIRFTGMIALEEAVKLLPVFALIALGRIRTAHAAMLCGALSGLTFGTIESIGFAYLEYPARGDPTTLYVLRFFVMAPMHAVWDALASGLVFFLSGQSRSTDRRKPAAWAFALAFATAVSFHILHNALQRRFGPVMQIATVFALLAPLYLMSRESRRRLVADGHTDEIKLFGDVHVLTISMATLFMAASVGFAFITGL